MKENQTSEPGELIERAKLNELRTLLLGLNQEELKRLQRLLRDPHEFANEISELLPYSIRKLLEKGEISTEALLPFVEDAMHKSIQKNPQRLADILFPVMGPAIRKAVSEDVKKMITSVNATLDSGLSPRKLKWRLQALTSQRTFTEIALANTYIYHVSQVFLIHSQTGLLLHHESNEQSVNLEADMISGMLTAIRDFVNDSFKSKSSGSLDEIQVGKFNLLIEQGPYAIVAAVIEGQPPADFRVTLMETIEAVHFNHAFDLEKFDGNTDVFTHTSKFLRNCLIQEKKEKNGRIPWPLLIVSMLVLSAAAYFIYSHYTSNKRFTAFVAQLDALPGYYVIQSGKKSGKYYVKGLKDIEAFPYDELLIQNAIDTNDLQLAFEPYLSLDKEIVIKRFSADFQPLSSVQISYRNGTLTLSGSAPSQWINDVVTQKNRIFGVHTININAMNVDEPPNLQWIIPAIEKYNFAFEMNIVSLNEFQQKQFDSLVKAAINLEQYNLLYSKKMAIYMRSFTNKLGNVEANMKVASRRAHSFIQLLNAAGVPIDLLEAQVIFKEDIEEEILLRSVRFEVFEKIVE